jgi:hypothetical protein
VSTTAASAGNPTRTASPVWRALLPVQRGTYVATMQNETGQMTRSTGKFVVVWKKRDNGHWQAIIDIDNADQ